MISVAAARTIVGRIVDRHGTEVAGLKKLGLARVFPSPDTLRGADLDGVGLTGARIEALHALAGAVTDGSVHLDRASSLEAFVAQVQALPGLGPWSAQYLAVRLGYADAFPASDLGLRRALEHLLERPVSAKDAEELSHAWRPWRALAATHLWFGPDSRPRLASVQAPP